MERRDFLSTTLKLVASGLILPSLARRAFAGSREALAASLIRQAGDADVLNGKILVVVNLSGGNDGLNTVIPTSDPRYYALRPNIAIAPNDAVAIDGATGFHPGLAPLKPLYEAGRMAIVQGVTYPNPNLSHFRSTDIWFSGSSSGTTVGTGWMARFIEAAFPDFPGVLPVAPYGLQQAFAHEIPLNGARGKIGVVVDNPDTFHELVGQTYTGEWSDELPATRGGEELGFVRTIDTQSFEYAAAIQAAAEAGTNTVAYPATALGTQLEIVARLISGSLDTPLYLAAEFGFDTHTAELAQHALLMESVGGALAAFMADLDNQGLGDDVVVVSMSEFGRRVEENGGFGTDHGTAAPLFVLGAGVQGGTYGTNPDLADLDENGNLRMQHDFRRIYATLLRGHFGASDAMTSEVLMGEFAPLPLFGTVSTETPPAPPVADRFHGAFPNPASIRNGGRVLLRFDLATAAGVEIEVFDVRGRRVAHFGRRELSRGRHRIAWDIGTLAPGTYLTRVRGGHLDATGTVRVLP